MEENVDYVSFSGGDNSTWSFFVRGNAHRVSGEYDEILGITKKICSILNGFYKPTKIRYDLRLCSEDILAYDIVEFKKMHSEIFVRDLTSDIGLSFGNIINDINTIDTKGMLKYIGGFYFDGKTRFILKGKDEYIDNSSKGLYALYDNYQVIEPDPKIDPNPISIEITQSNLKDEERKVERTDPVYYEIIFRSYTNMWFINTEIGEANRKRLRNVFDKIYANFDVVHKAFLSDHFSDVVLNPIHKKFIDR